MKLAEMILFLGIFVVMPVIIVSLVTRAKTNATNKRAEIALAAIEKNSDVNLEENAFLVTRKGGNQVVLYFPPEVATALGEYMEERKKITALPGHEDALFLSLQREGVSILFSTHITSDLEKCATHIAFIKDGEMQYTGSLDDFRDHYKDVGVTLEDIIVHVERRPLDEGAII